MTAAHVLHSQAGTRGVLCVGETMILLASGDASLRTAQNVELHVAGAESNVAISLSLLGHEVEWFSRLGEDPFGARVLDELAANGVDTRNVIVTPGERTGIYFKEPVGDSSRVLYYRAGSSASKLSSSDTDGLDIANRILCHASGITPALSASAREFLQAVMAEAAETVLSFDVNFRPNLWPASVAGPELLSLASAADIVFVGRDEAQVLWGVESADEIRGLLPHVEVLVVKDADIGATSFQGDTRVDVPALSVDVVEAIGAGDAFAAGYLDGWIRGESQEHCLRMGHLIAAHTLQQLGDIPSLPSTQELYEFAGLGDEGWAALHFANEVDERNEDDNSV